MLLSRTPSQKILIIPEFGSFGGTRDYLKTLLSFLHRPNLDCIVVLTRDHADNEVLEWIRKCEFKYRIISSGKWFVNKIKIRYLYYFLYYLVVIFFMVLKLRPKTIIVSSGKFNSLNLVLFPVKLLFIFHVYPLKPLNFVDRFLLSNYLVEGKGILTVSEFSRRRIMDYCFDPKPEQNDFKVDVIYPGLVSSTDIFEKKESKKFQILTLGHLARSKNPKIWIQVAKYITQRIGKEAVEFVWIGDGFLTNDYLESCRKDISNPDYDNIKFLGFLREVDKWYNSCTVYFQPSRQESFGLSVANAMRWAIPCVCSNVGGLSELVKDHESGFLLDPDDVKGLSDKIILLLQNKSLREKMGNTGRRYFEKRFSKEVWVKNMEPYMQRYIG